MSVAVGTYITLVLGKIPVCQRQFRQCQSGNVGSNRTGNLDQRIRSQWYFALVRQDRVR